MNWEMYDAGILFETLLCVCGDGINQMQKCNICNICAKTKCKNVIFVQQPNAKI